MSQQRLPAEIIPYPSGKGKNDPMGSSEVNGSATGIMGLKDVGPGCVGGAGS